MSGKISTHNNSVVWKDHLLLIASLTCYILGFPTWTPLVNISVLCFLDFSKAFDLIGHNVLIQKFVDIGVRRSLIPWIANFQSGRRQCVKLGKAVSGWLPVNAGVPQGTKLGPILFLIMVNDLQCTSRKSGIWKFVDDVSISETLPRNVELSVIKSDLNSVSTWASNNLMKLNAKKCKEIQICFFTI